MIANKIRLSQPLPSTRYDAFDALRTFMMLLGILLHLSLSYTRLEVPFWKIHDLNKNYLFDIMLITIHSFHLETFFLMSGFFAHLLYQKKGGWHFLKNRMIRILIPLLAGWPVVLILLILFQPASQIKIAPSLPLTFNNYVLTLNTLPSLHLWFLYYLLIFYAFFFAAHLLAKILKIQRAAWKTFFSRVLQSNGLIFIMTLATLPSLLAMEALWVDIPLTFSPITRLLTYYGVFFALGCMAGPQLSLLTKKRRFYLQIAIPSGILAVLSLTLFEPYTPLDNFLLILALRIVYAISTWSLVFYCVGFFCQHFNKVHTIVQYLSEASYWMYLMHLPLLIYFQHEFNALPVAEFLRPVLVLGATLLVLLLSYQWMVRDSFIGTVLNGKRFKCTSKSTPENIGSALILK